MRKISPAELLIIAVAVAAIGDSSADENFPTLPTVNVTGSFNTVTIYGWGDPSGLITISNPPPVIGQNGSNGDSYVMHALKCAKSYATTGPGASKGPRPGWASFSAKGYGWLALDANGNKRGYTSTLTTSPPTESPSQFGGTRWVSVLGTTYTGGNFSTVWSGGRNDSANLINTYAHEWAHQWGADEATATSVGNAAELAYLRDHGAKCGGL